MSQFFKRPRLGTLFELLVLRLVSDSFPGFRLFLVFRRVPIVRMLHGVRNCFFFFLIIDLLESCPEVKSHRSQLAQATERRLDFILGSRPSTVNPPHDSEKRLVLPELATSMAQTRASQHESLVQIEEKCSPKAEIRLRLIGIWNKAQKN